LASGCVGTHAACVLLLQELWKWLQDNNIVQRLLRTGLHHKQYMTEVSAAVSALRVLLAVLDMYAIS
jgi:hypothetical protein